MREHKKIMIAIVILILVLVLVVILILRQMAKINSTDYNSNTEFEQEIIYSANLQIKAETNRSKYYAVEDIINTYMRSIRNLQKEEVTDSQDALYSILDEQYISEFNIDKSSIKDKFNIYTYNEKVYIDHVYEIEKSAAINIFIVYGTTINTQEPFQIMVKTDSANNTFSLFPQEFMQKYGYSNTSDANKINITDSSIQKNGYNTFEYKNVNNEQMAIHYFEDIKNKVYETDGIYNLLDEEYKAKKFGNIEEYNSLLDKMKTEIMQRNIVNYKINNYDDYTQYILVDQEGSYYIVNETAVMEYTLMLDNYTVDLPEFIQEYNNSSDAQKTLLNIQKVFLAINDGDYKYVYNKLDTTFKQNNFPTLELFEEYVKQNFYKENSIGYSNYQTNNDLNIYTVTIENANDETSLKKEKNIIMQLKDGTDFVMSFNV